MSEIEIKTGPTRTKTIYYCKHPDDIPKEELIHIVETDEKTRYEFSDTGNHIRAFQGHSIKGLFLGLTETKPPDVLYHGTPARNLNSIFLDGLMKMDRHHVHLHTDISVAKDAGNRRGKSVILNINSKQMYKDGFIFFISGNNIWFTDRVPSKYLTTQGK